MCLRFHTRQLGCLDSMCPPAAPDCLFAPLSTVLQTLFQEQLQGEGSARTLLVVAVHDYESLGEEGDALTRERVLGDLQAVWDTVPKVRHLHTQDSSTRYRHS